MKKKSEKKGKNPLYLSYFLILIILVYLIFFFRFSNLKVSPPEKLSLVNNYFLNKPAILIFLNTRKILSENEDIIEIKVKLNFLKRKAEVFLKISEPVAIIYDIKQGRSYKLDNYGRITPNLGETEKLLNIISYKEINGGTMLNQKLRRLFSFLFEFSNVYSFPLSKAIIHSNFDVSIFNKDNQQFLFDPHKDHEEQIKKLYLFLEYQSSQKIKKATRIDLRIPQKIYFK